MALFVAASGAGCVSCRAIYRLGRFRVQAQVEDIRLLVVDFVLITGVSPRGFPADPEPIGHASYVLQLETTYVPAVLCLAVPADLQPIQSDTHRAPGLLGVSLSKPRAWMLNTQGFGPCASRAGDESAGASACRFPHGPRLTAARTLSKRKTTTHKSRGGA